MITTLAAVQNWETQKTKNNLFKKTTLGRKHSRSSTIYLLKLLQADSNSIKSLFYLFCELIFEAAHLSEGCILACAQNSSLASNVPCATHKILDKFKTRERILFLYSGGASICWFQSALFFLLIFIRERRQLMKASALDTKDLHSFF